MTKLAFFALTFSPLLLAAQNVKTPADPETVTKVIHVRYVPAESLRDLVGHGNIGVFANNGLKAIVLKGTEANVTAAEQAIKELDVPSPSESARDVELTIYVIGASTQGSQMVQPVPELEPVFRQLKAVFPYASYQLLDSVLVRGHEDKMTSTSGLLRSFPDVRPESPHVYNIIFQLAPRSAAPGQIISLDRFVFDTGVGNSDTKVKIDTHLDLKEGQKVVVGKTNVEDGNSALFIVVTAKFVP